MHLISTLPLQVGLTLHKKRRSLTSPNPTSPRPTNMHTKQDTANCHYPTLLRAAESAKDMGDTITKWLSRSNDVLKDDRADKTRRTVRHGGSLDDQPHQIRL
jgi:hypothetical protein